MELYNSLGEVWLSRVQPIVGRVRMVEMIIGIMCWLTYDWDDMWIGRRFVVRLQYSLRYMVGLYTAWCLFATAFSQAKVFSVRKFVALNDHLELITLCKKKKEKMSKFNLFL